MLLQPRRLCAWGDGGASMHAVRSGRGRGWGEQARGVRGGGEYYSVGYDPAARTTPSARVLPEGASWPGSGHADLRTYGCELRALGVEAPVLARGAAVLARVPAARDAANGITHPLIQGGGGRWHHTPYHSQWVMWVRQHTHFYPRSWY